MSILQNSVSNLFLQSYLTQKSVVDVNVRQRENQQEYSVHDSKESKTYIILSSLLYLQF